ncbi:MAG: hypothetical protein Q8L26_01220 [Candidatus Omnitrophota bacterium]|nr:hypothetical protein [Candidatus Omnitrophota bacterium]
MLKNIFKISILLSLGFLFILGCGKTKNIDDLLLHFKNHGLSVEEPPVLTKEEKQVVEGAKNMFTAMGFKAGKKAPVERKKKIVEGVKIGINRYANNTLAQEAYQNLTAFEGRRKKRAHEDTSPYFQKNYFLSAPFILEIAYYDVKLVPGALAPYKVRIDESVLSRIKKAFEDFK